MLLGGLWHGPSFTFIAWGAWHGFGLSLERLLRGNSRPSIGRSRTHVALPSRLTGMLLTYVFVHVGWVFFRAQSFAEARRVLEGMFVTPVRALAGQIQPAAQVEPEWRYLVFCVPIVLLHGAWALNDWRGVRVTPTVRSILAGLMLAAILLIDRGESVPFLYFQF